MSPNGDQAKTLTWRVGNRDSQNGRKSFVETLVREREREVEKMFYLVLLHFHYLYTFIGISSFESQGAKPCNTTVCCTVFSAFCNILGRICIKNQCYHILWHQIFLWSTFSSTWMVIS